MRRFVDDVLAFTTSNDVSYLSTSVPPAPPGKLDSQRRVISQLLPIRKSKYIPMQGTVPQHAYHRRPICGTIAIMLGG